MPNLDRRSFLLASGAVALSALDLRAADPVPLKLLLFGGDLPEVRQDLAKEYAIQVLTGGTKPPRDGDKPNEDNVAGLEQLATADVWIGSVAKRTFPNEEQLGHFKKYLEAGKPFVGYRAASH